MTSFHKFGQINTRGFWQNYVKRAGYLPLWRSQLCRVMGGSLAVKYAIECTEDFPDVLIRVEEVRSHNAHNQPHSRHNGKPECALCDLTLFYPKTRKM